MTETNKHEMIKAQVFAVIWLGVVWLLLITIGLSIVGIFWQVGGSLTQLNQMMNNGLVIGFITLIIALSTMSYFFIYPAFRDAFYTRLLKRHQRIHNIDLVKEMEHKHKEEISSLKNAYKKLQDDFIALVRDNKNLLDQVNNGLYSRIEVNKDG